MRVIGRGDGDRVDVLAFLVEHLAIVLVPLGLRKGVEAVGGVLLVDVAEGVDVLDRAHAAYVVGTHSANADARDAELVARRNMSSAEDMRGHDGEGGRRRGDLTDEGAAGYRIVVRHRSRAPVSGMGERYLLSGLNAIRAPDER